MLGNVFIEDTFRLRENILLSSNNDANEQAHQTFEKKEFRSNLWSNYDVLFLKWFQSFSFFKIDFGPFLVSKSKNKLILSFHLSLPHIEASLKTFLCKVFI